jgi:RimJ/RimL family protein N-acetyltransferase
MSLEFRLATEADTELLFQWRNDFQTRKLSLQPEPVPWEGHKEWVRASLKNSLRRIYIVMDQGQTVGTLRSDASSDAQMPYKELSWTVAPEKRGHGYGRRMLSEFVMKFPGKYSARIKKENTASIKIAQAAGFSILKEENNVLHFVVGD